MHSSYCVVEPPVLTTKKSTSFHYNFNFIIIFLYVWLLENSNWRLITPTHYTNHTWKQNKKKSLGRGFKKMYIKQQIWISIETKPVWSFTYYCLDLIWIKKKSKTKLKEVACFVTNKSHKNVFPFNFFHCLCLHKISPPRLLPVISSHSTKMNKKKKHCKLWSKIFFFF